MKRAADPADWHGRVDAEEGPSALRWHQRLQCIADSAEAVAGAVALLGFACDAGVSRNHGRPGAARGPAAIRAALAGLAWHGGGPVVDLGDVVCEGDSLEAAQRELGAAVSAALDVGLRPLVLGGGHEVAWGSWQGIAGSTIEGTAPRVGILNIDAHFDLRQAELPNSGTPFRQIAEDCAARGWRFEYLCLGISEHSNTAALFERAAALGVSWLTDRQMVPWKIDSVLAAVRSFLARLDHLYLTIDLDALPAALVPGVSAPAACGVDLAVVEAIIETVATSGKLMLGELAELNPAFDVDNRSARVAARLAAILAQALAIPRSML